MAKSKDLAAAHSPPSNQGVVPYEQRLNEDSTWALTEGSLHFQGKSEVQKALRRIATRLVELKVDYAVAGCMALFLHGYRRYTENVNILVQRDGLQEIHKRLEGSGYVRYPRTKSLRDTVAGVQIGFMIAGEYPGDGRPKPVAFPDPQSHSVELAGLKVVRLEKLVELKLASGISNPGRIRDLADIQELAKYVRLPEDFAMRLDPYVRDMFIELCSSITDAETEAENVGEPPPVD
jgi:hypothetical protein